MKRREFCATGSDNAGNPSPDQNPPTNETSNVPHQNGFVVTEVTRESVDSAGKLYVSKRTVFSYDFVNRKVSES